MILYLSEDIFYFSCMYGKMFFDWNIQGSLETDWLEFNCIIPVLCMTCGHCNYTIPLTDLVQCSKLNSSAANFIR